MGCRKLPPFWPGSSLWTDSGHVMEQYPTLPRLCQGIKTPLPSAAVLSTTFTISLHPQTASQAGAGNILILWRKKLRHRHGRDFKWIQDGSCAAWPPAWGVTFSACEITSCEMGLFPLVHSPGNGLFLTFQSVPGENADPLTVKLGMIPVSRCLGPSGRRRARSSLRAGRVPLGLGLSEAERGPVVRRGEATRTCLMTVTSPALHVGPDARPWNSETVLFSI